jgi:hypothetical protein
VEVELVDEAHLGGLALVKIVRLLAALSAAPRAARGAAAHIESDER